ncbi:MULTISPECIES: preprotein translocase subunit SecG [Lactococcus]|uniref:Protein-export membrane protein SecG n=1 Tax=Lactococcus lactis subsp. cremoris TaxID=1359 RepID=A0A166KKE4_LACLC|nr:preprotein translocase subunit SecG [Lactococcus cremoris]KZK08519.1 Preprotein translocase subunit SecG [Lactococcus cremoris]
MYSTLIYMLIVVSLIIIMLVLLQPSKQQDALSLLSSDQSSALFEKQKLRGFSLILQYTTAVLGGVWLILGIILMYLGSH